MNKWAQAFRTAAIFLLLIVMFFIWGYMNYSRGYQSAIYSMISPQQSFEQTRGPCFEQALMDSRHTSSRRCTY
jgi:hypothetical protein